MFAVHVRGTAVCIKEVTERVMIPNGSGKIVNVASLCNHSGAGGKSSYCAAKAGLLHLTSCVAAEEAHSGLRALSVAPGIVDTDMQALIRSSTPEQFPQLERFKALKRDAAFNSPAFVARHFLAAAFDPDYPIGDDRLIRVPDEK